MTTDVLHKYIIISTIIHFSCAVFIIIFSPAVQKHTHSVKIAPIHVKIVDIKKNPIKKNLNISDHTAENHTAQKSSGSTPVLHKKLSSERRKTSKAKKNKIIAASFPVAIESPAMKIIRKAARIKQEQKEPHREEEDIGDEPIPLDTKDIRYSEYFANIKREIGKRWSYPEEAAMLGLSGGLRLKFIIGLNGELADIKIVVSSGHSILDDEAIAAVKKASPYNPIPENIKRNTLPIIATFNYFPSYDVVGR